jgi:Zn finger protein HypA/HybF involved in hydrogenase expression
LVAEALEVAIGAARKAGATRIERLTFALPTGGHVTRETLEALVLVMSRGTLAEGAAVSVEFLAAERRCVVCGTLSGASSELAECCLACGGPLVERGDVPDLALASIDVE